MDIRSKSVLRDNAINSYKSMHINRMTIGSVRTKRIGQTKVLFFVIQFNSIAMLCLITKYMRRRRIMNHENQSAKTDRALFDLLNQKDDVHLKIRSVTHLTLRTRNSYRLFVCIQSNVEFIELYQFIDK